MASPTLSARRASGPGPRPRISSPRAESIRVQPESIHQRRDGLSSAAPRTDARRPYTETALATRTLMRAC
ncbi:hypothetical protein AAFF_G00269910 [Aldrovandia affinis]|uniref:Uncharacterized protein n=1 Tax=Aldrovandia affinis TaxID=143900 RepID=A0AAD7STL2_9TELE|nr:hypothetical protein AAFF_G00269910 [Aldrovandia affinis]